MVKPHTLTGNMLCLSAVLLLGACTLDQATREVLIGNDAYSRGEYQDATVHYLNAQKSTGSYQAWMAYNLGNVYYSLGETAAAMDLWAVAARTTDHGLLFNVQFNRGIAWYESGHYAQAYAAFRETLELNPGNMDAKLNLELTQKKLQSAAGAPLAKESTGPALVPAAGDAARLLEYVRRKEGRLWIPALPPATTTENGNDW